MLNLIDEHTRESLLVRPERRWSSAKVIEALADVMVMKGVPEHIRSDNGPEFVAQDLRRWLADTGAKTLYIEPGSPWENGYCESFNSKLRDEFLNGEIFYSLKEVQVLAERWLIHYNTIRPHSSLGYRSPAPESWLSETKTGYGEVESKVRFPLHAGDARHRSGYLAAGAARGPHAGAAATHARAAGTDRHRQRTNTGRKKLERREDPLASRMGCG